MRWRSLVLVGAAALSVTCVKSAATQCGDDLCPIGLTCAQDRCVDPAVVTTCQNQSEGDPCDLGKGGSGTCQSGLCIVGRCGDGIINGVEECDGAALGGKTCLDFGASQPGGLACTADCGFDPSGCTMYCGNGVVDGAEQCDGSNYAQKTCTDYGFYGGALSCTETCTANFAGCAGRCGDGMINGLEPCDGSNLNGQTCTSLGHLGSGVVPLACGSGCSYTAESCTCGGVLCPGTQQCIVSGGIASCQ